MSNPMIMQMRIEKSKLEKEEKEISIKIRRLMNELALLANPYCEIEDIDVVAIEQNGDELLECKPKLLEIKEKIRQISKDLGEV